MFSLKLNCKHSEVNITNIDPWNFYLNYIVAEKPRKGSFNKNVCMYVCMFVIVLSLIYDQN